ncbi:MAG: DUF5717 family protein [Lachnospiraceae bacterium]|nr:DUF5717 family protein [Lachnospiraceae bacterium]
MKSAIDRILEGNFNQDNHTLEFSSPVIDITVNEGAVFEGEFTIFGPKDRVTSGVVSSSSLRMSCPVTDFSGREVEVPFSFNAEGLSNHDEVKGEFRIISNQGEYTVPFNVKIGASNLNTSLGNIKNMFHFTNLSRTNWTEAVNLFYSDDFEILLGGAERQYISAYRVLKEGKDKEQNLEEFLLNIKKKQPVEFIIEEPNVRIDNVLSNVEKRIIIQKNGWGYSKLKLSTKDSFINLSTNEATFDDFDANTLRIPYTVEVDKLHEGRNIGTIVLENPYNHIEITVCAIIHPINRKISKMSHETKHLVVNMMQYYEAFRTRKISANTWMSETNEIVDRLCSIAPDNLAFSMFHIQLLITSERYNEASWHLEQIESDVINSKDDVLYCYYYYLTSLINRSSEHTEDVIRIIEHTYEKKNSDWRMAWLLLYTSEEYARSPITKWELLAKQFDRGSNSPVIYVEAYQVLVNNPTLLSYLGKFEIQVLKYMAKKEILTVEVVEQFMYLLGRIKNYDKNMFSLLVDCYKMVPSQEVLQAICTLLINTGRCDSVAFNWYEKAIEEKIRVTKLYEHYMMSFDVEKNVEIPKIVLLYFAIDSSLDPAKNAFLYAYVYRNKTLFPELFENYQEAIERFTLSRILTGQNDRNLAFLYRNILTESMITPEIASGLSKALFVHAITIKRDDIKAVIVKYNNLNNEYIYPVKSKEEYIPLYGSNYQIALANKDGIRFAREEDYSVERLTVPDKYASMIGKYVDDNLLFDLWICEHGKDIATVREDNVLNMKRFSDSPFLVEDVRKVILANLMNFYYENDILETLDELLENLEMDDILSRDISDAINLMVVRGMYEKAFSWICIFGGENVDSKVVIRLCARLIALEKEIGKDEENKTITSLIFSVYENIKHEDALISYLVKYFLGTSKEMRDIWKVARESNLNTALIEERILTQLLYTNAYVSKTREIFESYAAKYGANKLSMAFISQICFDYFVHEKITDDEYFNILQKFIDQGADIPFVCRLAYTKYYSLKIDEAGDKIARTCVTYLKEIVSKGMVFPYFKNYANSVTYMHRFIDKVMIEYRVKEGSNATIHYMIEKNSDIEDEYIKEELKNMYHGICVKQFVLFFGEKLQYYIVESDGETEQLTESGTLGSNDMDQQDNPTKYGMINDIAISRTLGDYGTMDKLMREYFQNEYLLDNLFTMV